MTVNVASSIPAAKQGILDLLTARAALATVQREWSHPGELIEKESIFFADAEFNAETTPTLRASPHHADEDYQLPVIVSVHQDGDDARATETRMWALVAEVESAIRADKTLNAATGVLWGQVSAKRPQSFIEDGGRTAECVVFIAIKARI